MADLRGQQTLRHGVRPDQLPARARARGFETFAARGNHTRGREGRGTPETVDATLTLSASKVVVVGRSINARTESHSRRRVQRHCERQLEVAQLEQPHHPGQEPMLLSEILRILKART